MGDDVKKAREMVMLEINSLKALNPKNDFDRSIRKAIYKILADRIGVKRLNFGKLTIDQLRDIYCIVKYRRTFKEIKNK